MNLASPSLSLFIRSLFKDLPYLMSWSEEKNDAGN
jgi:hypothetical protein